ncbi:MAG: PDZ domain-containing protein [Planctomycetes bacterium]|nr:PDZ domain-containing protein [Planctomycetota bacterium]
MGWTSGTIAGLLVVVCGVHAVAPVERPPPGGNDQEANAFASQLLSFSQILADQYVREVGKPELLAAAIYGLYDAARRPTPVSLLEDLKAAKSEAELFALVGQARRTLGADKAVEGNKAIMASVSGLAAVLDPHCVLVPASDFQRSIDAQVGFGLDLDGEVGRNFMLRRVNQPVPQNTTPPFPFRVTRVHPGGPAQRAGVRPGDVITHVEEKEITADLAEQAYNEIFAGSVDPDKPREMLFTILRAGNSKPLNLRMTRRAYDPESVFGVQRLEENTWSFWIDKEAQIAYIRLGAIDPKTPAQLADALIQCREAKGLILDLRWCPGGYLNQSAEVAAAFLAEGKIASIKYRHPERQGVSEFRADSPGMPISRNTKAALLVLVNGETSGAGELIAAALQDNERAKVAGQRTLGKASVQTPIYLTGLEQFAFKLSAGTFVRPSEKNLQRFSESKPEEDWGVRPDKGFEIPLSIALSNRLKDWHQTHTLRPPTSREALPLDDLEADPQRFRAIRLLKDMMK